MGEYGLHIQTIEFQVTWWQVGAHSFHHGDVTDTSNLNRIIGACVLRVGYYEACIQWIPESASGLQRPKIEFGA